MAAAPPPSEIQYQLSHASQDKGTPVVIVVAVFGFLALATTVFRLIYRFKGPKGLGWDDALIVAAGVFAFGECLSTFELAHYGSGRHLLTIPPEKLVPWAKWNLVLGFCYSPAMLLAKCSILVMVYTIFHQGSRFVRFGTWVLFVYTFLWTLAVLLVIGLSCKPFDTYWSSSAPCSPSETPTIITASFNTVGDLAYIILPQPCIWRLEMNLTRKLSVSILLGLGIFATLCGIIRIAIAKQLNPFDATYTYANVGLFFALEVLVTIICANLPAIYSPSTKALSYVRGYASLISESLPSLSRKNRSSDSTSRTPSREDTNGNGSGSGSSGLDVERSSEYGRHSKSESESFGASGYPRQVIRKTTEIQVLRDDDAAEKA